MKTLMFLPDIVVVGLISFLFASCKATSPSTPTPTLSEPIPTPTLSEPIPTPTLSEPIPTPIIQPAEIAYADMPAYAAPGKYTVGWLNIPIQDGDHTVNAVMFYPVQQNGTPDTTQSPYPLVVFSPGFLQVPLGSIWLLNHLASFGFVVISWTPRGEEIIDTNWIGGITRPHDVKLLIDYAEKLTAPDGQLAGLIDTQQTAIAGHSAGGWTALIEGGAQIDFGWCATHQDWVAKTGLSDCAMLMPHQQELAAAYGLKKVPTGMWPSIKDARIQAVVAMAPDGDVWGADFGGVAVMKVPTLIMTGGSDPYIDPELFTYPIYEHLGSPHKYKVVLLDQGHFVFTDQGTPTSRQLINHFVTAFLLAELKGDTEAAKALLPANVSFPTVKYETSIK